MFSVLALALLPILALANPQYGGYGDTPSPSSAASSAAASASAAADSSNRVTVNVGSGGLVFSPSTITASNGTLVTFVFPSTQHSVTQSTFANPCTPLTGSNGTGFDSGLTSNKQFTLQVTDDTKPVWFFCKVPGHCGSGMVGAINPPSTGNTFANFQTAAKGLGSSAPTVSNTGVVTGGVGAVATAGPSASGASASASGSAPASTASGKKSGATSLVTSGGAIVIALAVAMGISA